MLNVYPLKPVITSNQVLASVYNQHPESILLTSCCVAPSEIAKLLSEGATFEAVVLLDDADKENVTQLLKNSAPVVEHVTVSASTRETVSRIHEALQEKPLLPAFYTMGGG